MYTKEEAKQLRLDFWEGFGTYSKSLDYLIPNRGRWILYYTGTKHLELKFDVERHIIRVALELNHRDENRRFDLYTQLEKYKVIIEDTFGEGLIWDYVYTTASGNEVCRIYVEGEGFDFHCRDDWSRMYEFMAENMSKLEMAFLEVKDLIKVEW